MQLLSRAHLLKLLIKLPECNQKLAADALGFGYRALDIQKQPNSGDASPTKVKTPKRAESILYTDKHRQRLWTLVGCNPVIEDENTTAAKWPEVNLPEKLPYKDVSEEPVLNRGQWQNLWDQALIRQRKSRQIHIRRSVSHLSRRLPIAELPRRPRKAFTSNITLIIERTQDLFPAWSMMMKAKETLAALLGSEAVQAFYLPSGPTGVWSRIGEKKTVTEKEIERDTQVILIGCFGALNSGRISLPWHQLLHRLNNRGLDIMLMPLCPLRQGQHMPWRFEYPDPRARHSFGHYSEMVETLLNALSQAWLVNIGQLRLLRMAITQASLHTELQVYNRTETDIEHDSIYLHLREQQLVPRLKAWELVDEALKKRLLQVVSGWQNSLTASARDAEKLQSQLRKYPDSKAFGQIIFQSRKSQRQIEQGKQNSMDYILIRNLLPVLRQLQQQPHPDAWQAVIENAQQVAILTGEVLPLGHKGLKSSAHSYRLAQQHHSLVLRDAPQGILALGDQAYCQQTGKIITGVIKGNHEQLNIIDRGVHWHLNKLSKPAWAERIWRSVNGLFAAHEEGAVFQLLEAAENRPRSLWKFTHNPWSWAKQAGIDQHGLWAELTVDSAAYRLRWIPPGTFMMGSPEIERDREKNEHLHEVTLSQGYWLGETTVTQALWKAVTGDNPGDNPKDMSSPVNNVSWNDCRAFITELQKQQPLFDARMPTEAQWEYACRAGTQTPFWWGDEPSADNGNMSSDYNIQIETHYPGNDFGLKSMHGNLFEWCQDWYGEYRKGSITDPTGPKQGQDRVLRGGSWILEAQRLRAADRNHRTPDNRFRNFGLRLAGGQDPQASGKQGAAQTADRDEGTEEQGGGQGRPLAGKHT